MFEKTYLIGLSILNHYLCSLLYKSKTAHHFEHYSADRLLLYKFRNASRSDNILFLYKNTSKHQLQRDLIHCHCGFQTYNLYFNFKLFRSILLKTTL